MTAQPAMLDPNSSVSDIEELGILSDRDRDDIAWLMANGRYRNLPKAARERAVPVIDWIERRLSRMQAQCATRHHNPAPGGTHPAYVHPDGRTCLWIDGGWFVPLDVGGEGYDCEQDHPTDLLRTELAAARAEIARLTADLADDDRPSDMPRFD